MKKLCFVLFLSSVVSLHVFAQADPDINIVMSPASLQLNAVGTLNITTCNNGNNDIVANSLRITISVGTNASISSLNAGSDARWTIFSHTTGTNNTYVLTNTGGTMTKINGASPCASINLQVTGTIVGGPSTITGTIGYIASTNCLIPHCGGCACPPNASQGNSSTANDNSTTSLIVTPGGPTPINLLSFNAIKQSNNTVLLNWQTTSEINSKNFEVQFSKDGLNWTMIGTVLAAGTSSTQKNYSLVHNNPVHGSNYYRLKQNDLDANFTYSPTRIVLFSSAIGIKILPNPVNDKLYITSNTGTTLQSVILYSAEGKQVYHFSNFIPGNSIDMSTYSSGTYMLKITDSQGNTEVKSVFKKVGL